jgi:general secretion pathway protein D
VGFALLLAVALACCTQSEPVISSLPPLPDTPSSASPRVNGNVGSPQAPTAPILSYGTLPSAAAAPASPPGATGGNISLDFADTDIREVVAQILGTMLKVNYTIDPAVHGSATLRTTQPLARSQLLPTLQSLLAQNGAALVQSGSLYRVVPVAQAAAAAAEAGTAGSLVVALQYASADDLAKVLQPFVGDGGKIAADAGRNALVVSGSPDTRNSLIELIRSFDIDILAGQSYALLSVENGGAKDYATALQDAFRSQAAGAAAGPIRVVPMERINAVLVVTARPGAIEQVRRVAALVDQARRRTIRSWHVYYLQNSHAEDVAFVLQEAFTPNNVTARPTNTPRTTTNATGTNTTGAGGVLGQSGQGGITGSGQSLLGSVSGSSGLLSANTSGQGSSPLSQVGQATSQAQQALPAAAAPLTGPLEGGGNEPTPDSLRIIPDPQNNALLVYGTGQETDTINAMLHKIDILPLQVRIDAVIAEVQLNDNLQYGTQFFFQAGGLNGILNFASQSNVQTPSQAQLNLSFPGFFIGGHGSGGAPFAINALQQVTTVKVLSSPQLMVLDNQPARLQVGSVVPYLSQSSQSTISNSQVINSINYQQTGVVLDVTPRVNSGGLVTLDISQEVSDVQQGITTQGINSPTFFDRSISSRVVVQDGQTVGLAGLISDNTSTGNQGIPWLKDIPLLGALAGNQNNTRQRTELLMLLTPHVLHDQRDARALTEDMREHLINAAAVPVQLNSLRPSGSADPNARVRQKVEQDLQR